MNRLPVINNKHKICIICEGLEEHLYLNRLLDLSVWSDEYDFTLINAKGESRIFSIYQNAYNNARYEMIIIFCDTDRYPQKEYSLIKEKINQFHNSRVATNKVVIFANPCTMQIILSHFGDVKLSKQSKKLNAPIIKELTGIDNYDAKEQQVKDVCSKIYRRTYPQMKQRVEKINFNDNVCCSTNFIEFVNKFENDDTKWIKETNKLLEKN